MKLTIDDFELDTCENGSIRKTKFKNIEVGTFFMNQGDTFIKLENGKAVSFIYHRTENIHPDSKVVIIHYIHFE